MVPHLPFHGLHRSLRGEPGNLLQHLGTHVRWNEVQELAPDQILRLAPVEPGIVLIDIGQRCIGSGAADNVGKTAHQRLEFRLLMMIKSFISLQMKSLKHLKLIV